MFAIIIRVMLAGDAHSALRQQATTQLNFRRLIVISKGK